MGTIRHLWHMRFRRDWGCGPCERTWLEYCSNIGLSVWFVLFRVHLLRVRAHAGDVKHLRTYGYVSALTFGFFRDGCTSVFAFVAVRLCSSMHNLLLASLNLPLAASDSLRAADRRPISICSCCSACSCPKAARHRTTADPASAAPSPPPPPTCTTPETLLISRSPLRALSRT